jgi:phosphopantothenoylcysteine synthetase/decarboxylase
MSILYVLVCGSSAARGVGTLVELAQRDGWDVCVVTTPDGRKFIDVDELARLTGHPVRSGYKHPDEPDLLPPPDALLLAPATVNTINKWASGIADTLVLGLLVEGHGKGLPMVAIPYTNREMAAHPAFLESISRLRTWGVTVLFGPDVMTLPAADSADADPPEIPWHLSLACLPRP